MTASDNDRKTRAFMKKRWREWGMDEDLIKICMVEVTQRQIAKRKGELDKDAPLCTRPDYKDFVRKFLATKEETPYESPDDSKYKPRVYDPLLTGTARVTGKTAKAVRRKNTYTDYDYNQKETK